MEYKEIIELIEKVNSSTNITGVKIEREGFSIHIRKNTGVVEPIIVEEVTQTNDFVTASTIPTSPIPVPPAPTSTSTTPISTDTNIASPGQVKYARDMVGKKFEGNMDASVDWLAHLMEVPLADVPHPSTWDTMLTRDMAGVILDNLEGRKG